jgi:TRAP-type mannitol/chloroaromatic compound transport system permease large subunit
MPGWPGPALTRTCHKVPCGHEALTQTGLIAGVAALGLILAGYRIEIVSRYILIPLYEPIVRSFGFDDTWFRVLLLINLSLGSITPRFGYTLFAPKGARPELSAREMYACAWVFVAVFLAPSPSWRW